MARYSQLILLLIDAIIFIKGGEHMKYFQKYSFTIGSKVPLTDFPSIVKQFLEETGLSYEHFEYTFSDLDRKAVNQSILDGSACETCWNRDKKEPRSCEICLRQAEWEIKRKTGCEKALKKCPELGPLFRKKANLGDDIWLTNIDNEGVSEEKIMSLLPQIHRGFGFDDIVLSYSDIDFFGDKSYDSSITYFRCNVFPSQTNITVSIGCLIDEEILDTTNYRDIIAKLLPVKPKEQVFLDFTDEEKLELIALDDSAGPLADKARSFFDDNLPKHTVYFGNCTESLPLGKVLRSLCKEYGYRYDGCKASLHHMCKRLENGHYIEIEVDAYHKKCSPCIFLTGLGFMKHLWADDYYPDCFNTAKANLERLFAILSEAETTVIPELTQHYPDTPKWLPPSYNTAMNFICLLSNWRKELNE